MAKGKIYIGTSGWSNSSWKGIFYPQQTKSKEFLDFYAQHFNAAEINSTFYHIPKATTVENWIKNVPVDFKFAVKISQYLTHIKRLKEPEEPLERFFTAVEPLQKHIGPVLIQLPPSLKFNYETVSHFFEILKSKHNKYAFVLEARHASWFEADALSLLVKYGIALVLSESGGRYPLAEPIDTHNIYIRFHGPEKLFDSPHSDEMLEDYAKKILKWQKKGHDVWVFFNNTMNEHALENSAKLKEYLGIKPHLVQKKPKSF
jgi:uncharacterized protein YecE (DUF72 family)